jgi:hypothetical protein
MDGPASCILRGDCQLEHQDAPAAVSLGHDGLKVLIIMQQVVHLKRFFEGLLAVALVYSGILKL